MSLSASDGDAARGSSDDSEPGKGKRRKLLRCDSALLKRSGNVGDGEPSFPMKRRVLRSANAKAARENTVGLNGIRKKNAANVSQSGGSSSTHRVKRAARSESDRQWRGDDSFSVENARDRRDDVGISVEKTRDKRGDSAKKTEARDKRGDSAKKTEARDRRGDSAKKTEVRDRRGDSAKKTEVRDKRGDSAKKTEEEKTKEASVENKRITRLSAAKNENNYGEEGETEEKKPAVKLAAGKKMKEVEALQMDGTRSRLSRKRGSEVLDASDAKKTPGSGKIRPTKHLDHITPKRLKNNGSRSVGISPTPQEGDDGDICESPKSKESGRSDGSVTPQNGPGDALCALSRSKKTGRFQKSSSPSADKGKVKASATPSTGSRRATRSSSMQLRTEKTASAQKKPSPESKSGKKASKLDSSNRKSLVVKGQSSSTSTSLPPTRQMEQAERTELQSARKKLRAQLKDILLNAGWKIDLRPRIGRQYYDSVYISPKGNSCWSITKAYGVFLRQENPADGVADSNSGKSSKRSKDKRQEPLVTPDALAILNKVIRKKRCDYQTKKTKGSKAEIDKSKRKVGDVSHKKKDAVSIKHQITKHLKVKGREFKKTKRNNTADSTAKAIIRIKNRIDKRIVSSARKKSVQKRAGRKPRGNALLVRGSDKGEDVYVPYEFGRTILTWLIDLEVVPENRKIVYMNPYGTEELLGGWLTKKGIHCNCCDRILSVSEFEEHAGSNLRQPYKNIYINGASLLQFQTVALKNHGGSVCQRFLSVDTAGEDSNDDTCGICGDGGDLMCCDSCPSTFHLDCLGLQKLPTGDWLCMSCSCKYCNLVSSPNVEEEDATEYTLFSCALCEKKYHQKCIPEEEVVPVCSVLHSVSFCGYSCKKIFQGLQKLVGVKNELGEGFSLTLLQHLSEDVPELVLQPDQRVECNAKIAVAFTVMDECFLPIIDQRSGINLINNVVYSCGSNFNRLNYRGFYTYILERDEEIISVATLRIHGAKFAEMPFIGTRNKHRLQGMCRRLLNGIESALHSLNVKTLVIPAISELVKAWTNVFGFKHAEISLREELRSVNILVFPGTGLLYKPIQAVSSEQPLGVDVRKHTSEAAETSLACSSHGLEPTECELEVNAIVHGLPEVSPLESFDPRLGSEPQVSEHKSSEPANVRPSEVTPEPQVLEYKFPEAISDEVVADAVKAPDSSEVAPEVCDSPRGTVPLVLVCKSSEEPVEAAVDDNVQVASSFGQESDAKGDLASAYTAQDPLDNGKHISEDKCKSVDDSTSTLQESGDDTLLPDLNDICTSPNTNASSAGSGETGHQSDPYCSEESNSDAGHFDEVEAKPADRVDDGDVSVVTKTSAGKEGNDSSVTSKCAEAMKTSESPSKRSI